MKREPGSTNCIIKSHFHLPTSVASCDKQSCSLCLFFFSRRKATHIEWVNVNGAPIKFCAFMIIGCWWWWWVMLMAVAVVKEIKWKADRKVYLFPSQHFITGCVVGGERKGKKICFITKFIAEKSSIKWEIHLYTFQNHVESFWCWFWMNDWWGMRRYFAGAFGMKKDDLYRANQCFRWLLPLSSAACHCRLLIK